MDGEGQRLIGQLRELRERLHLSQEQLAQRLGVSFATVNRWEGGHALPSARSKARLEQLLRQTETAAPAERTDGAGPGGGELPVDPRPFIGRSAELAELQLLWAGCRTLTLTGAGGIGKSRLAVELLVRSEDPVLGAVRLDTVRNPALAPAAVAMALGVRGKPNVPERVAIVDALRDAAGVLFLDTCEHVAEQIHELLTAVLASTRSVRVLTTSQVPLGVPGEHVWRVPGLRLPAAGHPDPLGSDAVQFFLARARERAPSFAADGPAADQVIDICRRLDGIPLALGLAAAWMGTLSPAELVKRWGALPELLADPGAELERHRTLRAAIGWSAALLTEPDRQLVAELSAFVGPFTIADAEAVTAGSAGPGLLHSLRRLVEVSWLEYAPGTEVGHFRMLDPLRGFGREALEQSGNADAVRRRHAEHAAELARQAEADRFRADLGDWPRRLGRLSGDLQAALAWCAGADPELGAELAIRLLGWWRSSGRIVEGRHWVGTFRESAAGELARARAGCAEALLAMDIGAYEDADRLATEAQPVLEAHDDALWTGRALTARGWLAKDRGDMRSGREHMEAALVHQQRHGDQHELATGLNNLGTLTADADDLDAAERYYRMSLEVKRGLGNDRSRALTMANLADTHTRRGRRAEARELLTEAMDLAAPLGDEFLMMFLRLNLGDNLLRDGDHAAAVVPLREALEYASRAAAGRYHTLAACALGQALCALGDEQAGLRYLWEARGIAQRMGDEILLAQVRAALAEASADRAGNPPPKRLSAREVQVLQQAAGGLANREIAERLHISPATVQRHLANIYTKLDVRNRTEATRRGLDLGLWPRAELPARRTGAARRTAGRSSRSRR